MKKSIVLVLFALFTIHCIQAQVGINTSTPDSSAALDIQSPSGGSNLRGVLFPRMTTNQRNALGLENPAQSLFVFDTDDMLFYYYDGSRWLGLVPTEPAGTSGPGIPHVNGDITLTTGTVSAPNLQTNTLDVTGFSSNALVPTGAIIMWSGTTLPAGWGLCNGHYYAPGGAEFTTLPGFAVPGLIQSPNLQGQFVVGLDPLVVDYNSIGNQAGANSVTLVKENLPKHTHVLDDGTDGAVFSNSGAHSHEIGFDSQDRSGGNTGTDMVRSYPGNDGTYTTNTIGDHRHTGNTGDGTTNGLNAAPFDTRPPYYVLAYIIKLP